MDFLFNMGLLSIKLCFFTHSTSMLKPLASFHLLFSPKLSGLWSILYIILQLSNLNFILGQRGNGKHCWLCSLIHAPCSWNTHMPSTPAKSLFQSWLQFLTYWCWKANVLKMQKSSKDVQLSVPLIFISSF